MVGVFVLPHFPVNCTGEFYEVVLRAFAFHHFRLCYNMRVMAQFLTN